MYKLEKEFCKINLSYAKTLITIILFYSILFTFSFSANDEIFNISLINIIEFGKDDYHFDFQFESYTSGPMSVYSELYYVESDGDLDDLDDISFTCSDIICNFRISDKNVDLGRFELHSEVNIGQELYYDNEVFIFGLTNSTKDLKFNVNLDQFHYIEDILANNNQIEFSILSEKGATFDFEIYTSLDIEPIRTSKRCSSNKLCPISITIPQPIELSTHYINIYSKLGEVQKKIVVKQRDIVNIIDSKGNTADHNVYNIYVNKDNLSDIKEENNNSDYNDNKVELIPSSQVILENQTIKEILFLNTSIGEINIKVEDVSKKKVIEEFPEVINSFAIDPSPMNETLKNYTITFTASGNAIYKCEQYYFDNQTCFGNYTFLMSTIPGQTYTLSLNPVDPIFVEVNEPTFSVTHNSVTGTTSRILETISNVIENQTLLLFTSRTNDPNPNDWQFIGHLENETTLNFTRYNGAGVTSNIEYQILESNMFFVQRGIEEIASSTYGVNITLTTPINLSESFIVVSGSCNSGTTSHNHQYFFSSSFINSTAFEVKRRQSNQCEARFSWQVIEFDKANVQSGTVFPTTSDVFTTDTISSVNVSQSFIITGVSASSGSDPGMNTNYYQSEISDSTTVLFNRTGTDGTSNREISYFVISHPYLNTQKGTLSITGDTSHPINTISNLSKSFHVSNSRNSGGGQTYSNNAHTCELQSVNSLFFNKETGSQTSFLKYQVIEFVYQNLDTGFSPGDLNITSTSPLNLSGEDLVCSYNLGSDVQDYAISWFESSNSLETLLLPFEGGVSNSLNDYSSNSLTITNQGATYSENTTTGGSYGTYSFDGTSSYINLAEPTNIDYFGTPEFTLMSFVYVNSTSSGNRPIICKSLSQYCIQILSSGLIEFCVNDSSAKCAVSNLGISTNTWVHVAGKIQGTTLSLFIDGVEQSSTGTITTNIQDTAFSVEIGRDPQLTSNLFHGYLDEVRIYSSALSNSYISQLSQRNYSTLSGDETKFQETWQCSLIPFSYTNAGSQYFSNSVSLIGIQSIKITSNSGNFMSSEDLICSINASSTNSGEITYWSLNGNSLESLFIPFEGGINNSLRDYSTNNISVTNDGGAVYILDGGSESYGAYSFNGFSSYINITQTPEIDFTGDENFTLSTFAYVDSLSSGTRSILCKGDSQYCLKINGSNYAEFCTNDGSLKCIQSNSQVSTNTWTHIGARILSSEISLFVNGIKQTETATRTGSLTSSAYDLIIGADPQASGNYFNGYIDDIKIYNSEIDDTFISHLSNRTSSILTSEMTQTSEIYTCSAIPFSQKNIGAPYTSNQVNISTDELFVNLNFPTVETNTTTGDIVNIQYNITCNNALGCNDINISLYYGNIGEWYNNNFLKRKEVGITNSMLTALTNFTIFIDLTRESSMQNDGSDLRIYEGSCGGGESTLLPFELSYSNSTHFGLWVKDYNYETSSNTYCIYYDNLSAVTSIENSSQVWNEFTAVWHFEETGTTTDRLDSSGNNYDAAPQNFDGDEKVSGRIGQADTLDGTTDYLAIRDLFYNSQTLSEITICTWFSSTYVGGSYNSNWAFIDFDRSDFFDFYLEGDGSLGFSTDSGGIQDQTGTISGLNNGDWQFGCAVYNGSDKILYTNGVESGRVSNAHSGNNLGSTSTRYGFIGEGSEATSFNGGRNNIYYEGAIDEMFYIESTLKANYIQELYNSMGSSNIVSISSEEVNNITLVPTDPSNPIFWVLNNSRSYSLAVNETVLINYTLNITSTTQTTTNIFAQIENFNFPNLDFPLNIFEKATISLSLNTFNQDEIVIATKGEAINVTYNVTCTGFVSCTNVNVSLQYRNSTTLGEAGSISLANNNQKTIIFKQNYTSTPIVILTLASNNLNQNTPQIPVIHSVSNTQINVSLCQDYGGPLCSTNSSSEIMHYMIFNRDALNTANLSWIDYGVMNSTSNGASQNVVFSKTFDSAPYIFTTAQTRNLGGNQIAPTSWSLNIGINDFDFISCDHPDSSDNCAGSTIEEFAYVAINPNAHELISAQFGTESISNSDWTTINFNPQYEEPIIAVSINSESGGQDPVYPMARNIESNEAEIRYCEADRGNYCDTHNAEDTRWFAIESGEIVIFDKEFTTVPINRTGFYTNTNHSRLSIAGLNSNEVIFSLLSTLNPTRYFEIQAISNYTNDVLSQSFIFFLKYDKTFHLLLEKNIINPFGDLQINVSNLNFNPTTINEPVIVYLYLEEDDNLNLSYTSQIPSTANIDLYPTVIENSKVYLFNITPNNDESVFDLYSGSFNSSNRLSITINKTSLEGSYSLGLN